MGWKDADWAMKLNREPVPAGLTLAEVAVLSAIAHHTDDKTHQTFVGQTTLAEELGANVKTVQRAVGVLCTNHLITRQPRTANGYKTTDLLTLNTAWEGTISRTTLSRPTKSRKTVGPDSKDSKSRSKGLKVRAEEITQDHSEDHPVNSDIALLDASWELTIAQPAITFDDFYTLWPVKRDKPAALKAWNKASTRESPAVILDATRAYTNNPHRPDPKYIPYPATWLNRDGWTETLDGPETNDRRRTTRNEHNLSYLQSLAAEQNAPKGISA